MSSSHRAVQGRRPGEGEARRLGHYQLAAQGAASSVFAALMGGMPVKPEREGSSATQQWER